MYVALAIVLAVAAIILSWVALRRRMVLQPVQDAPRNLPVTPGMTGTVVVELRPGGVCEFGDVRMQAMSTRGVIPAGSRVRVVAIDGQRPTVKMIEDETSTS